MNRQANTERLKLILLVVAIAAMTGTLVFSGASSRAQNENANQPAAANSNTAAAPSTTSTTTPANTNAQSPAPQATPTPLVEGCLSCHGNTEPMHRPPRTPAGETGELQDGRDGQKLTCTYCHGGNPAESKDEEKAHVQPRFPAEWKRNGKRSSGNPERSNTLLARESREFVRFINPGDLRVSRQTCGACHSTEAANVSNSMMRHGAMLWGAALYNNGGFPFKDARFGESYSDETGAPERLIQTPAPDRDAMQRRGLLAFLDPLPRWEISQPGNLLRVFERGGKRRLEVGLPDRDEDPGKPDKGLSARGLGTLQRTDPVYLGLQKTRLLDPTLNFLGTNDQSGDYRSSGCTACHIIYANDSSVVHSSKLYAGFGSDARTATKDKSFDSSRNESGHPIRHQLTSRIPTSQCMVCHMHPGTNMVATYLGMTWWDNETDARAGKLYPDQQHDPSQDEEDRLLDRNPEAASLRGNWSDPEFLKRTGTRSFNDQLTRTQFADFHGHGWIFRAVFKKNRRGEFLDRDGKPLLDTAGQPVTAIDGATLGRAVAFKDEDNVNLKNDAQPAGAPVHLKDIHLEKGMHCVDCHFQQDAHGDGNLYNEPRAAIEIGCIDCHGTVTERAALVTSGPAAQPVKVRDRVIPGRDLTRVTVSGGANLFQRITRAAKKKDPYSDKQIDLQAGDIIQNSMVEPGLWWRVKQTRDTIDPDNKRGDYNWKSRYAKTVRLDPESPSENKLAWGDVPLDKAGKPDESKLAHRDSNMTCYSCHSSWMTSCFGCHLSMTANRKMPNRHNEGDDSRNFTTYNFQVIRDDVFMLGRDGTVTGHRIAPVRSSSAILVSSQNQNREWIYHQQQTVSAEGFAGQSFNTHVPHTVRAKETKDCSDCHVSRNNDNNAWLAQTMLQGSNFVNFMGRYIYVAAEDALEVVPVTEHTEPQAVIGSSLHSLAYPRNYDGFVKGGRRLKNFYEHVGNPEVLQVQLRGEYAYVAAGAGGLRVYDVAQIDHKGFSERITTAPVSRFGQRFWVKTKYAAAVAAPSTLAVDPARWRYTVDGQQVSPTEAARLWNGWQNSPERDKQTSPLLNEEQPIHPLYAYLYVADREEGLILVGAATLLDGDPLNNYLKRALDPKIYPNGAFNENNLLTGANNITLAGNFAYITTDRNGLVVVDLNEPLRPRIVGHIGAPDLVNPRAVAIQFRYGFVADDEGLKVIDVTDPLRVRMAERRDESGRIVRAFTPLAGARDVYVARTYAYVAAGASGLALVDVTVPDNPGPAKFYNAGGAINDARGVKVAMTNASLFAYVADGRNGLRVLQLLTPEKQLTYAGFSPRIEPEQIELIATFRTKGPALSVSKGLDRDRAVDESGNQVAVFGRRGARPLTLEEMRLMYLSPVTKQLFQVQDLRQREGLDCPPADKNCLPLTEPLKQSAPKPPAAPATSSTRATGELEGVASSNLYAVTAKQLTAFATLGGLSLFAAIVGWRKRRKAQASSPSN
ncbi:MAG: hypothetical protein QOF02_2622 [Blastocatellia bacterium]|jgi:hypothetical protein|nr:hypothetical protein [Blastocatellia bacterium]